MAKKIKFKNRRIAWDISAFVSIFTLIIGCTVYLTRVSTQMSYVLDQVADFKSTQIRQSTIIDGIRETLHKQDIVLAKTYEIVSGGKRLKLEPSDGL